MPNNITGNKGEWSEIYVLLRLLSEGKIYAADENLRKLNHLFFPILKIFREEARSSKHVYIPKDKVQIFLNGELLTEIEPAVFADEADYLYEEIISGKNAFPIERTERFMRQIGCTKLKAPSADKTDITMQIRDVQTGHSPISGFSVKSELGNPPTLINAGGTTNFIYQVEGIDDILATSINAIETRTKINDRMRAIFGAAQTVTFARNESETFAQNLMLIDSRFAEMLAYALLYHYRDGLSTCAEVVAKLEETNPMSFPREGMYTHNFKTFLCAAALGMTPGTPWNGLDDATGGYVVVTSAGDVLAYHIYNRDFFKSYLLKRTRFERASTTRHGFASLYKEHCKTYLKLNLQVRFL